MQGRTNRVQLVSLAASSLHLSSRVHAPAPLLAPQPQRPSPRPGDASPSSPHCLPASPAPTGRDCARWSSQRRREALETAGADATIAESQRIATPRASSQRRRKAHPAAKLPAHHPALEAAAAQDVAILLGSADEVGQHHANWAVRQHLVHLAQTERTGRRRDGQVADTGRQGQRHVQTNADMGKR
jgi:hypothetical protein